MAKIRIHELAKELNVESKEIIAFLGEDLKAQSGIEEQTAQKVRNRFTKKNEEPAEKPAEKPAETPVKPAEAKPAVTEKKSEEKPAAEAEKKEEAAEPVKKKKPVLLFHPENSSYNSGKTQNRGPKNNTNPRQNQGQQNQKRRDDFRGNQPKNNGFQEKRTVIKPNVPKTAEMYKENIRDVREEKTAEPMKAAAAVKASEEVIVKKEKVQAETPVRENIAAAETAAAVENVQKVLPAEPEVRKNDAQDLKTEEKPASKNITREAEPEKTEEKPAEKKATGSDEKVKSSDETMKQTEKEKVNEKAEEKVTEKKPEKPAEEKKTEEKPKLTTIPGVTPVKPVIRMNVYRMQEEKRAAAEKANAEKRAKEQQNGQQNGQNAQNGERRPSFKGKEGNRVHFVDNRGKDGQQGERRPYNGDRSQNGENRGYRGNAQGGQNRGGFQNKDGQNKDNRGVFSKDNRNGNSNVRFNRNNSQESASALMTKADIRGKKNNTKTDKDRNNYDKNDKRAENFKNLSKETNRKPVQKKEEEQIKMITLPEVITMKELAEKMKQKPADLIKKLFLQGKMVTLNTELSYEEAEEIAMEYDILCEQEEKIDVIEELLKEAEEDEKDMVKRPPVVCVMGHVDHGKTSLLDAIRSTHVTDREAGGITQHIGAYMIECNGEPITFLDTPGHEAFTAMRMRGAQATDIAVLVVAADDGVMPQTVEAINHAKAAGVDIIVAVNKIDKPAANIDRVKQELTEYGLVAEDWGGSTIFVPVSAKMHQNIDQLLEMILLLTEVKELKANPNREMRGIVIEAKLDKGRGPVATVLVQKGTLKVGDFVSAGSYYGRVRAMLDADGNNMKSATPSTPVEILGLNGVPNAGEVCIGHKNEKDARSYADTFIAEEKKKMLAETKQKLTMDSLFAEIQAGNIKELPLIVKADVQGSVEAVRTSLEKLSNEEVSVKVIHGAVGAINESDVSLASASNAIVIGFNVKPDAQAKMLAEQESVDMRLYRVIYQAIDDVEAAMKGMLAPVYEEQIIAHAEIRQTFKASGVGTIAGSYVLDGTLERGCSARITRDKEQIFDGPIASLKRFKDDVKEVREGFECGIVFEKFNDLMEGDIVEAYKMVQVARE